MAELTFQVVAQLCGLRFSNIFKNVVTNVRRMHLFSWLNSNKKISSKMEYAVAMLPHPHMADKGGEDAFFIEGYWIGISDGVGGWAREGIDAGAYSKEFMLHCQRIVVNKAGAYGDKGEPKPKDVLVKAAKITKAQGSATCLIASLHDHTLHVANLGDSGFILVRDWHIISQSRPMQHAFNCPFQIGSCGDDPQVAEIYSVAVSKGDVLVCATDGLFDNLFLQDIMGSLKETLGQGCSVQEAANYLAKKARVAQTSSTLKCPFSEAAKAYDLHLEGGKMDDVTVVVAIM